MWNLISSNKLCSDRTTTLSHRKHLSNVANVKSSINNRSPDIPTFLKSRAKQQNMKETRDAVIQYENRVLLDKMMEIEKKKTDLNPTIIAKKHFYPTKSLNTTKRVRELKKVNVENKDMLKRLQSARSLYSINKWIDDDQKNNEYRRLISQNGRRAKHSDFSMLSRKYSGTLSTFPNIHSTNGFQSTNGFHSPNMHFEFE